MNHSTAIKKLTEDDASSHDFIVAQGEVNKKIDKLDAKFDRLDGYLRRHQ